MIDSQLLLEQFVDEIAERVVARLELRAAVEEPWRLLTLEEAAARLGRSERTVRGWVKAGALHHVRLDGGALAFELEDLRAFAEARRVSAEDAGSLSVRFQADADPARGAGSRGEVQPRRLRVR